MDANLNIDFNSEGEAWSHLYQGGGTFAKLYVPYFNQGTRRWKLRRIAQ